MRSVFSSVRRGVAILMVSAALLGPASVAAAEQKSTCETLLTAFMVWLQSRLTVPGG